MGLFDGMVNSYVGQVSDIYKSKLTSSDLYGFKSRQDIEAKLRADGVWQDSGPLNPGNEKIVDNIWQQAELNRPIYEETLRKQNEQKVSDETATQQKARAEQRTLMQSSQGRRGTILTSPQGVQNQTTTDGRKTLLGE